MPDPGRVTIRGPGLDPADLLRVALEGAPVEIAPEAIAAILTIGLLGLLTDQIFALFSRWAFPYVEKVHE